MKLRLLALLIFLFLVACKSHYVYDEKPIVKAVDYSSFKNDSTLTAIINPYKTVVDSEMSIVIGYLGEDMEKGNPEGKLGNFAADVFFNRMMYEFEIGGRSSTCNEASSFCLINNGGLRVGLQKGQITKGKIFELLPFENYLVVLQIRGKDLLKELPAYVLEKKGSPISHNAKLEFKSNNLVSFEINGIAIDSNKRYWVITNDYMANGGDNMLLFKRYRNDLNTMDFSKTKMRDVMIEYFQKNSSVQDSLISQNFGRIKIE